MDCTNVATRRGSFPTFPSTSFTLPSSHSLSTNLNVLCCLLGGMGNPSPFFGPINARGARVRLLLLERARREEGRKEGNVRKRGHAKGICPLGESEGKVILVWAKAIIYRLGRPTESRGGREKGMEISFVNVPAQSHPKRRSGPSWRSEVGMCYMSVCLCSVLRECDVWGGRQIIHRAHRIALLTAATPLPCNSAFQHL